MNSSAKTETTHPLLNLNAASARRIAAAVGKLAGGCVAAVLLVFTGIAAIVVTKRWAKTSPYLTGCFLLLCGSLCILIALAGIFAVILVLFLLLLPFMIMAIKIAFMAGLSSK